MSKKEDNSFSFAIGILGGVIGGVIAGLLFAPKPGEETCEDLKNAIENIGEKVSPEINVAKKQALDLIEESRCRLENQYQKFSDDIKAQKLAKAKDKESDVHNF